DGRFVAILSNESGHPDIFVAPFPGPGRQVRVTSGGAWQVRWPRKSGEILYVTEGGKELVSVPVRTAPALEIGKPTTLFTMPGAGRGDWIGFAVSADGQ